MSVCKGGGLGRDGWFSAPRRLGSGSAVGGDRERDLVLSTNRLLVQATIF